MTKIFFYHMPKAGGSSIRAALDSLFAESEKSPIIENDIAQHESRNGDYAPFCGYLYYAGHYGVDIFEAVKSGHFTISNFRHPVARIYSLYRYFKAVQISDSDLQLRQHAAIRLSKQVSFAEFVASEDPVVSIYVSDQQARQLTGSPWARAGRIDLDAAKRRIDELTWFHVCEKPTESARWLSNVIGIDSIPVVNVSAIAGISGEAEASAAVILQRNQGDLALYDYAVDRFERQAGL